jgi:hypothetical protein
VKIQTNRSTVAQDMARSIEKGNKGTTVARCIGFWATWHAFSGDPAAIVEAGIMTRHNCRLSIGDFHAVMGVSIEAYRPELGAMIASAR